MIRVVEIRENTSCPACRVKVYPDGSYSDPACDQCGARYHAECVGLAAGGEARRPCGCAGDEAEATEARERSRAELLARLAKGTGATFARAEEAEAEALSAGLLTRDVLPDEDELTQAARAAWGAELMSRGELYMLSDANGTVLARAADVDDRAAHVAARAAVWAVRYALGGEDEDEGADGEDGEDRGSVGEGPARRRAASLAWDHWPECLGDVDGGPLSAASEIVGADEAADLLEALIDTGRIHSVDARRAADVVLTASEATTRDRWGRAFLSRRTHAHLRRELEQWLDPDAGRELLGAIVAGA